MDDTFSYDFFPKKNKKIKKNTLVFVELMARWPTSLVGWAWYGPTLIKMDYMAFVDHLSRTIIRESCFFGKNRVEIIPN